MSMSLVERGALARRSIYAPPPYQKDANRFLESPVFEFRSQLSKVMFYVFCIHLCLPDDVFHREKRRFVFCHPQHGGTGRFRLCMVVPSQGCYPDVHGLRISPIQGMWGTPSMCSIASLQTIQSRVSVTFLQVGSIPCPLAKMRPTSPFQGLTLGSPIGTMLTGSLHKWRTHGYPNTHKHYSSPQRQKNISQRTPSRGSAQRY